MPPGFSKKNYVFSMFVYGSILRYGTLLIAICIDKLIQYACEYQTPYIDISITGAYYSLHWEHGDLSFSARYRQRCVRKTGAASETTYRRNCNVGPWSYNLFVHTEIDLGNGLIAKHSLISLSGS